ncbi:uridylate kinase [Jaminaea rosea]|uniref:Uridylate kinase n=1 Tax=Jaminaea rosea TaxID=1569628 RepID=A0A316V0D6_9BASI|nr:uridylate kinase [Jaminaea rosea]PWN31006.1 uridylate kinase [Jaminaea rosea]
MADEITSRTQPLFSSKDCKVIFVLGGPGSGKGTQCARLVDEYGFVHLSAGDLLRAEQNRKGSQFGELIDRYIREGQIVPQEITIKLLENAIKDKLGNEAKGRVLIDGFPRKMDQALLFDQSVCPSQFVLFLDCTEEIMLQRLMKRGETSGRADDNAESIKKRFRTFLETSMPVVEHYEKQGKVVKVDSKSEVEQVEKEIKEALMGRGIEGIGK